METAKPHSPLKAAICAFKQEEITIKKSSDNPFFKSKYADLATILDAIESKAAKYGLVITSSLRMDTGTEAWVLETTLEHKDSDEKKISTFPVFGGKPQEIGSSITYARRYNIQSLLNLAAEDDDGNATANTTVFKTASAKKTSATELMNIMEALETLGELEAFKEDYKQDINAFKISKFPADKQFYEQLVKRGEEIKKAFTEKQNFEEAGR